MGLAGIFDGIYLHSEKIFCDSVSHRGRAVDQVVHDAYTVHAQCICVLHDGNDQYRLEMDLVVDGNGPVVVVAVVAQGLCMKK